ncbi:MAG: DsrE family protein [Spirochaetaceae bacterium]|nr:DsrE family protein [Spirochaetaceae bacterium]
MDKDTLIVLWTQDNKTTLVEMIAMYARNAKRHGWFKEVRIIIWGASSGLAGSDTEVQEVLKGLLKDGVSISACKACADDLCVSETLESIGVEVEYWGEGLTAALKKATVLSV